MKLKTAAAIAARIKNRAKNKKMITPSEKAKKNLNGRIVGDFV